MKKLILLILFMSASPAQATQWSKFVHILCGPELNLLHVSGLKIVQPQTADLAYGEETIPKIREKYGLHYPLDEPIRYSCTVADRVMDVHIDYDSPTLKHCGADPAASLSLTIDGKKVLHRQNFMVTCFRGDEHISLNTLNLSEEQLQLCLQNKDIVFCDTYGFNDIPGEGLAIKKLFLDKLEEIEDRAINSIRELETFNDYIIRIYDHGDDRSGRIQVLKEKKVVFEETIPLYTHSDILRFGNDLTPSQDGRFIKDITADGEPNLVISHYSGGAHCCFDYSVYSLGDEFRLIDKIETSHGIPEFRDLDGDGGLEVIVHDWVFAYWNASFADSPAPRVVLRYTKDGYLPDYTLMKRPRYEIDGFKARTAGNTVCGTSNSWSYGETCILSDVWQHMLDLIYEGYPQEAWTFLDEFWTGDKEAKNKFIEDFKRQLALSKYAGYFPID